MACTCNYAYILFGCGQDNGRLLTQPSGVVVSEGIMNEDIYNYT